MEILRNTHLLLEVTSVLFVDEDEVKVITRAELFVHVAERWRQVKPAQKQPDWDRFAWIQSFGIHISGKKKDGGETRTSHGGTVHDFKLCDGLALVVLIWWRTRRLAADDRQFHVLDFDAHEQKVDLPHNHILKVISA